MNIKLTDAWTKAKKRWLSNQRCRILLSAAIAFGFNLLYAIYHCVLGILNSSLWFIAMCAFYGLLAIMRFCAILCERNHQKVPNEDTGSFVIKLTGLLLVVLGIVLAVINYISLSQNIVTRHDEIIMITIATYTFYKITNAIVKAARQHKNPSLLLRAIRNIGYADVAASILTLQRSMLVSFESLNMEKIRLMNAMTGAAVCLFILILGLSMIRNSNRKEVQHGKIKTGKSKQKNRNDSC